MDSVLVRVAAFFFGMVVFAGTTFFLASKIAIMLGVILILSPFAAIFMWRLRKQFKVKIHQQPTGYRKGSEYNL